MRNKNCFGCPIIFISFLLFRGFTLTECTRRKRYLVSFEDISRATRETYRTSCGNRRITARLISITHNRILIFEKRQPGGFIELTASTMRMRKKSCFGCVIIFICFLLIRGFTLTESTRRK
jgi:hypothetical protein